LKHTLINLLTINFYAKASESKNGMVANNESTNQKLTTTKIPSRILNFSLGGMGIIVLALAVLPMLGVSGMELYHAESSGISNSKILWYCPMLIK
jgi:Trk-type K+ transport system membrane component